MAGIRVIDDGRSLRLVSPLTSENKNPATHPAHPCKIAVGGEIMEYPKIETLYERDEQTHRLKPELILKNPVYGDIKTWRWTEKAVL